ncbi:MULTISPECIES: carboxymuconolactone decarboxylase family protein [unclassified Streptomyces]|uniref:carboxymuconolactone decarboxylase family protein n=1 Tax=unclassified Streptomyces TaxID=2593676 RepID=UPI003D8BC0B8
MSRLNVPPLEGALAGAQRILDNVGAQLGFVSNMFKTIASNPTVLEVVTTLQGTLSRVLDAETQHSIALAVAQANRCSYCLAIHTYVATEFGGMSGDDIELGRVGSSVDPKRAAAARFAQRVVDNRGQVSDAELVTAALHRARVDWLPHCSSSAAARVSPSPRGAAGLEQGESCDSGHRRCVCAGAQRTGVGAGQKPVSLRCLPTVGVPDHRAGIGRVRSRAFGSSRTKGRGRSLRRSEGASMADDNDPIQASRLLSENHVHFSRACSTAGDDVDAGSASRCAFVASER